MQKILSLTAVLTVMIGLLPACMSYYRQDIQQGNVVDEKMVAQLRDGMSKRQVRYVLGTPLVQDPFHANRWDYVHSIRKGGSKSTEQSRLTVFFKNDNLARVERNGVTLGLGGGAQIDGGDLETQEAVVVTGDPETMGEARTKKKGFFRRMWEKIRTED